MTAFNFDQKLRDSDTAPTFSSARHSRPATVPISWRKFWIEWNSEPGILGARYSSNTRPHSRFQGTTFTLFQVPPVL